MRLSPPILSLIVLLIVSSCLNEPNKKQKDNSKAAKVVSKPLPDVAGFISEFVANNPEWSKNDVVKDEINRKFKKEFKAKLDSGILNDYPITLVSVNEYSKGKYAAHFQDYGSSSLIKAYPVNIEIIGLIVKAKAMNLETNRRYYVKGKFKRFLGMDFRDYTHHVGYNPMLGINNGITISDFEVSLGILLMDVKELKQQ